MNGCEQCEYLRHYYRQGRADCAFYRRLSWALAVLVSVLLLALLVQFLFER